MSLPATLFAHLLRLLPWSNTRQAWLERLSLVGVTAAVAALAYWAGDLAPWQLVLAWATLLLVAAVLFRRGWLRAFGPILWYDLVRTSRRARTYLVRGAYLLILLAMLWLLYMNEWPQGSHGRMLNSQISRFAEHFFYTFLVTQYVLMVLLTPAFTAGAIAEEKQKKTIQFLLASDLRSSEIVLGKLGSRMAHLGLLLLAGLPVLGAMQFLGGVDPHLVLAGFAGTAVTLASTAGVSLLASVVARPSRAALFLAYGWILLYVVLCCLGMAIPYWFSYFIPSPPPVLQAILDNCLGVLEAGNPVVAVNNIFSSDPIEPALLHSLAAYSLFHGLAALASTVTASLLLRRASLREPTPPTEKKAARRPPVSDKPMVWKEVHTERSGTRRWFVMVPIWLLIALSILFLVWGLYAQLEWSSRYEYGNFWRSWRTYLNGWVRAVGGITACLTLLAVGVQAAYSVRVERERETFDSLLTSPLSSEDILYGKWLGAILSVRWMLVWLAFVWGVGVLGGGLHLLAAPLLVLSWCVYAAAMASIGLWFSLVSRTSMRAVLYTILAIVGLSVGHWLIWIPCGLLFRYGGGQWLEWVAFAQGGLTPPVVLGGFFSFGYEENFPSEIFSKFITCGLLGLVVWGLFALILWHATNQRFKRDGGRVDSGAVRERTTPPHRLS